MIAYRTEIWCDGEKCRSGMNTGISHDDPDALRGLSTNLVAIRERQGWKTEGHKHYCPSCIRKAKRIATMQAKKGAA